MTSPATQLRAPTPKLRASRELLTVPPGLTAAVAISLVEDPAALLSQILPAARLTLWEAWSSPLELIALRFGAGKRTAIDLEPAQMTAGASWEESVYPADREKLRDYLGLAAVSRNGKAVDYRLIVGDGELLWVRHWLLQRSPLENGRRRLLGMLMPIPEQKHLEWECLRVSERECNRIGQELHDDLCQVLAGVMLMMHVVGQQAAKTAPVLGTELRELHKQVAAVTDRVRSMAHGLFPARLSYRNLQTALNDFGHQMETRFGVRLDVSLPRRLPRHSPEQIVHVYRILQEAVSNAVHHGGARVIKIRGTVGANELTLEIQDDGKGFPTSAFRPEGIGMHVMQYRAHVLGGVIEFKNVSPRGALLRLTYPFPVNQQPS